ncbi:MAG TPA: type II toxin-antitoxin system VapC family toxin [Candidatus Binataceae bacterium]|nr:type II toxin-antitoxin system VapC family toxin [Candidatus Binataceae bacterium]
MDTDVVAAAVLAESRTGEEASRLLAGGWDLAAPAHWKAEVSNVVWKAVQLQRIAATEIDVIISRASALPIESVDVAELWRGAVTRAIAAGHPAYDTLFVELAIRLRTSVASFDGQLQRKFPSIVMSPRDLLVS